LPNIVIHACKKYDRKNEFSETVCPAHWALFIYISTYCVETVKQLDYNRYSHLTRRFSGKTAALSARGPGFNFWLWLGFLSLIFCFVVVVFLLFVKKHIICHKILQFLLKCQFIQYAQHIAKLVTDYKGIKIHT